MSDEMKALSLNLAPELEEPYSPGFWYCAAPIDAFPENAGACVQVGDRQIVVFHIAPKGEWFACQNLWPPQGEISLSQGLFSSEREVPAVTSPLHRTTFSLETGVCLNGDARAIETYPVRIVDGHVLIGIPLESSPYSLGPESSLR